jgi:hypothetical protein
MRHPWLTSGAAMALVLALAGAVASPAGADSELADAVAAAEAPVPERPDICLEGFARGAARAAFLEAMLQLTAEQQPLWDKWQAKLHADAVAGRSLCERDQAGRAAPPSALNRDEAMTQALAAHLEALRSARPDLEALYRGLNPGQQALFDRLWAVPGRPPMPPAEPLHGLVLAPPSGRPDMILPVDLPPPFAVFP